MDNDVQGTEYCIGFATAITRAKDLITRQRTTLGSHERIGIFRIFGRDSGFTALYTAYVTAGRCVIPEVEFSLERLIELLLEDKRTNPSSYAFVIVSEGASWQGQKLEDCGYDAYGHKRKMDVGQALAEEMQRRTGEEIMVSDLTYDLRSGDPDALDQIVSITLANVAVDLIKDGLHGRLTAVQGGKYTHAPLPDPKLGPRKVDVKKLFNPDRCRPNYAGRIGSPLLLCAVD
jgi:6-phosphofructokinase 1